MTTRSVKPIIPFQWSVKAASPRLTIKESKNEYKILQKDEAASDSLNGLKLNLSKIGNMEQKQPKSRNQEKMAISLIEFRST